MHCSDSHDSVENTIMPCYLLDSLWLTAVSAAQDMFTTHKALTFIAAELSDMATTKDTDDVVTGLDVAPQSTGGGVHAAH